MDSPLLIAIIIVLLLIAIASYFAYQQYKYKSKLSEITEKTDYLDRYLKAKSDLDLNKRKIKSVKGDIERERNSRLLQNHKARYNILHLDREEIFKKYKLEPDELVVKFREKHPPGSNIHTEIIVDPIPEPGITEISEETPVEVPAPTVPTEQEVTAETPTEAPPVIEKPAEVEETQQASTPEKAEKVEQFANYMAITAPYVNRRPIIYRNGIMYVRTNGYWKKYPHPQIYKTADGKIVIGSNIWQQYYGDLYLPWGRFPTRYHKMRYSRYRYAPVYNVSVSEPVA